MFPLAVGLQAGQLASPRTRWYMSDDAVLAVTRTRRGWHLHSHIAARPGTGQGAELRRQILPAILAAADRHQVPLYASAADDRILAHYARDVPELTVTGTAIERGRTIQRTPQPAPQAPPAVDLARPAPPASPRPATEDTVSNELGMPDTVRREIQRVRAATFHTSTASGRATASAPATHNPSPRRGHGATTEPPDLSR